MSPKKLEYQDFLEACIESLRKQLGEEYNIQLNTILKNNSIAMNGVIILKDGAKISPNIYLDEYFIQYEQGVTMEEITQQILNVYANKLCEQQEINVQYTYEAMKDKIVYRLVNREKNKELLETCPYIEFLDLAITFHCLVHEKEEVIGTIRITNEHMKYWKITKEQLYESAKNNTEKLLPPLLRKMEDVLREILTCDTIGLEQEEIQFELSRLNLEEESESKEQMYILSNVKGINGATCLLYKDVVHNFARLLQCDLFILPSSIHEVILLPAYEEYIENKLEEMVKDINETQVPYEEVLSDHVYYYSLNQKQMTLLSSNPSMM